MNYIIDIITLEAIMKYHLDTIPVWDAYKQQSPCPLCILQKRIEKASVDFFLGSSVMEPETRIQVNKTGFCPNHFSLLYKVKNRLGLALLTHTHLQETLKIFNKKCSKISGREVSLKKKMERLNNFLKDHHNGCLICNRIKNAIDRYAYTILHLWDNDKEFERTLLDSKGFCLYHLSNLLKVSQDTLPARKQVQFLNDIIPLQIKSLEELEKDLSWFTQKFDYRNQDKPWGNSKDALPRALQVLTGELFD
jgi:hypothetical protein